MTMAGRKRRHRGGGRDADGEARISLHRSRQHIFEDIQFSTDDLPLSRLARAVQTLRKVSGGFLFEFEIHLPNGLSGLPSEYPDGEG